jgi:hypothetical protein
MNKAVESAVGGSGQAMLVAFTSVDDPLLT